MSDWGDLAVYCSVAEILAVACFDDFAQGLFNRKAMRDNHGAPRAKTVAGAGALLFPGNASKRRNFTMNRDVTPPTPSPRALRSGATLAPGSANEPASTGKHYDLSDPEVYRRLELTVRKVCPAWLSREREDLTQRAMLRLMERVRSEGSPEGFCASYIYRTAHNSVIDEIRKRRREVLVEEPRSELEPESESQPVTPAAQLRNYRLRDAIFACLRGIRAERRVAVSLRLQGHSVKEVARLMECNEKRVENMTSRGRADLRQCLEKKGFSASCPE